MPRTIETAGLSASPERRCGRQPPGRKAAQLGARAQREGGPSIATISDADQSAALREQMLAEIAQLQSTDEAADWVHRRLKTKNTLTDADADLLEAAFRDRVAVIEMSETDAASSEVGDQAAEAPNEASRDARTPFLTPEIESQAATPVILSRTAQACRRRVAPKTIRLRDKEHCKFVATQPCVVCGRSPTEAHHIRFAQPRALGRKVSDEYTVPVCRLHHRELHRYGDEASWWAAIGLDPIPIALSLWRRSGAGQRQVVKGEFPQHRAAENHFEETDAQTSISDSAPFGDGGRS